MNERRLKRLKQLATGSALVASTLASAEEPKPAEPSLHVNSPAPEQPAPKPLAPTLNSPPPRPRPLPDAGVPDPAAYPVRINATEVGPPPRVNAPAPQLKKK